jgi:hypothetical protein
VGARFKRSKSLRIILTQCRRHFVTIADAEFLAIFVTLQVTARAQYPEPMPENPWLAATVGRFLA